MNMSMRKIGVVGSFAAGAAFALAPLAAAAGDETSAFDFSDIVKGEIASMNFLFGAQATMAGVGDKVIDASDINPFSTIASDDMNATFSSLLFGFNPENVASDPGSYNLFNGAIVQFDNGLNSLLFASMNNGEVLEWDSGALFGGTSAMDIAANATSGWDEASDYFQFAAGDMAGYFSMPDMDL